MIFIPEWAETHPKLTGKPEPERKYDINTDAFTATETATLVKGEGFKTVVWDEAPKPKRGGRPKGSKNKAK